MSPTIFNIVVDLVVRSMLLEVYVPQELLEVYGLQ